MPRNPNSIVWRIEVSSIVIYEFIKKKEEEEERILVFSLQDWWFQKCTATNLYQIINFIFWW